MGAEVDGEGNVISVNFQPVEPAPPVDVAPPEPEPVAERILDTNEQAAEIAAYFAHRYPDNAVTMLQESIPLSPGTPRPHFPVTPVLHSTQAAL
jgi:hypothetical protein